MTNLDSILKSRDITLPIKVCRVKAMVFPVVRYGCESWTIKKAEHRRIDAFELWCWRRLLSVPWTPRRLNQSILKEIKPEYSLEGLKLKPKLQYFGHQMWRADSLEKTLKLVRIEDRKRMGQQRMRWLMALVTQWSWAWASSGRWWRTRKPGCRHPWCHKESDTNEWLNDNNNLPHKLPHLLEHRECSMYAHCPHFVISHIQILLILWNLLFFSRNITRQGALQKDGFY